MSEFDIDIAPVGPIELLHSISVLSDVFSMSEYDIDVAPLSLRS